MRAPPFDSLRDDALPGGHLGRRGAGPIELDRTDWSPGNLIGADGLEDFRIVKIIDVDDPEEFTILVVAHDSEYDSDAVRELNAGYDFGPELDFEEPDPD